MSKNTESNTESNTPAASVATSAEKRAATVASKREERIAERGYALPLVLTCKVTGKEVKYTSPSYIDKVIAKHGSLEKLQKNFVSRDGRAQQKSEAPAKPEKAPKAPKTDKPAKAPKAPKAPKTETAPATA
jgi:hypothetical protein